MKRLVVTGMLWAGLCASPAAWAGLPGNYPYQACFEVAARLHQVPLDLLLAVAATESAWDPDARSQANAHGIMQIQWPGTARHLGVRRVAELYNPCLNIELGARYLDELMTRYDDDVTRALAAYNYGPGRIDRAAALPAGARRYVAAVQRQQTRIRDGAEVVIARAEASAGDTVVAFASSTRARRYADALNGQVNSARFAWEQGDDGRYLVRMSPAASGLSLTDARRLAVLGWPGFEAEETP